MAFYHAVLLVASSRKLLVDHLLRRLELPEGLGGVCNAFLNGAHRRRRLLLGQPQLIHAPVDELLALRALSKRGSGSR